MDILNPQIITIDGRRYRKMPYFSNADPGSSDVREANDAGSTYWEDEECDEIESCGIEKTGKGYTVRCSDIPSFYFKFICGKKNETKSRLERETKTQITIPRPGMEGDIVISGPNEQGVMSAKTRIELIVDTARTKTKPTHFISIPLACESTVARFNEFKEIVLEQCSQCKGFDGKMLQIPEKLHLTLGMMVLLNEKEIEKAGKYLEELKDEIVRRFIGRSPMRVILEGVECMNDDASEVVVLYAKVKLSDGSDRLQNLTEFIVDSFVSKRMMRREYDKVKLHATVVNTKFKDKEDEGNTAGSAGDRGGQNWKPKSVFDARKMFELFGNFNFGEVAVNSIHVSKRGSYGPDGGYFCEAAINI